MHLVQSESFTVPGAAHWLVAHAVNPLPAQWQDVLHWPWVSSEWFLLLIFTPIPSENCFFTRRVHIFGAEDGAGVCAAGVGASVGAGVGVDVVVEALLLGCGVLEGAGSSLTSASGLLAANRVSESGIVIKKGSVLVLTDSVRGVSVSGFSVSAEPAALWSAAEPSGFFAGGLVRGFS